LIQAVIFDLDGLLLDSESGWDGGRKQLVAEHGLEWHDGATEAMLGMSSPEWSRYMHETIELREPPDEIADEVVRRMQERYRERLPLLPGAREAIERLAARWPLGLASSSNRPLIDLALEVGELAQFFRVTLSSEEVARGKPAPDVYLEVARRMAVDPGSAAAIEDSRNGIRSAHAAGMKVVAIPNAQFPPDEESLSLADVVVPSLAELTPEIVEG